MKNKIQPQCNRKFIERCLNENKRVDGRMLFEYRDLSIAFGSEYGSCLVRLGNTKVISSISCEIVEPRATKPCEGMLTFNVDLSPMASPNFEIGRTSDNAVELMRTIEKSIKDSKCVDLESLCLIANEKIWSLKVELIVLNNDGNLVECCSVAALASLSHYKRNEVTVSDDKLIIHSFEEKHPIPLTIFFYPFCTSFLFYNSCGKFLHDPSDIEESVSDGHLYIAANSFREVITIHMSGGVSQLNKDIILQCCNQAILRSKVLTDILKQSLNNDKTARETDKENEIGFAAQIKGNQSILSSRALSKQLQVEEIEEEIETKTNEFDTVMTTKINRFGHGTVAIGAKGGPHYWDLGDVLNEQEDNDDDINVEDIVYDKNDLVQIQSENESDNEIKNG